MFSFLANFLGCTDHLESNYLFSSFSVGEKMISLFGNRKNAAGTNYIYWGIELV
jgi:hypothetical protein